MTKKWRWPVLNRGETANTRIPLLLEASSIIISTPPPIRLILTLIGHKSSQLERDRTQLTWTQPWLQLSEICVHLKSIFAPCSDFQLTTLFPVCIVFLPQIWSRCKNFWGVNFNRTAVNQLNLVVSKKKYLDWQFYLNLISIQSILQTLKHGIEIKLVDVRKSSVRTQEFCDYDSLITLGWQQDRASHNNRWISSRVAIK